MVTWSDYDDFAARPGGRSRATCSSDRRHGGRRRLLLRRQRLGKLLPGIQDTAGERLDWTAGAFVFTEDAFEPHPAGRQGVNVIGDLGGEQLHRPHCAQLRGKGTRAEHRPRSDQLRQTAAGHGQGELKATPRFLQRYQRDVNVSAATASLQLRQRILLLGAIRGRRPRWPASSMTTATCRHDPASGGGVDVKRKEIRDRLDCSIVSSPSRPGQSVAGIPTQDQNPGKLGGRELTRNLGDAGELTASSTGKSIQDGRVSIGSTTDHGRPSTASHLSDAWPLFVLAESASTNRNQELVIAAARFQDAKAHYLAELHWYEAHGVGRREFKRISGLIVSSPSPFTADR